MTNADAAARHRGKLRRGHPAGKRRRAREMAVQMLYQHEIGAVPLDHVLDGFDVAEYSRETALAAAAADEAPIAPDAERMDEAFAYARRLARGALDHRETIDERIRAHAENWRLERMPVIDRNILRLAIYEMFHESGVPKVVIVDEAIELAKKFGSEHSGRFVNGLLDGVLKAAGRPGSSDGPDAVAGAGAES